jgi:hypothetical protein
MRSAKANGIALGMLATLTACSGRFDPYSPGEIHRTVQKRGPDLYVAYFRREAMDKFGRDRSQALPLYLRDNKLVPSECAHGITYLRGGDAEGGQGWAEFRCQRG